MSDKTGLSVVVPVYNVENYLPKCLDSLLATEGIDSAEIILIDDGSTDKSGQIADEYSSKHPNIRVIHKENEGPSAARNLGIKEASGRYISFCDSDDEVVPDLYKRIVKMSLDAEYDMIVWDSDLLIETEKSLANRNKSYFSHGGLEKKEKVYTGKEFLETLLKNSGDFVATVWLGAYRKSFLVDNKIFFEKGLIHEDELWVPKAFINAQSVLYIPEDIYLYRARKGSIMNPDTKDRSKHVASLMQIYPSLYGYYDEVLADDPTLRELIEANLTKRYLHMIYRFNICKYGYGKKIDKKLLWRTSKHIQHKLMVLLLYIYAH